MNSKNIYKIFIFTIMAILVFLIFNLCNKNVYNNYVDKSVGDNITKTELVHKFLMSLDNNTLNEIGISKKDIINKDINKYNIDIISKNNNNYYIILHNKNIVNDKSYLTIFQRGAFSYKKIGKPILLNNVIDVFLLETQFKEKYIIFTRDLIGFSTAPLDLVSNLQGFVFNENEKEFVEAIKIIENLEEYQIQVDDNRSRYKKFRTKSDVLLTNSYKPVIEVLTNYYEAISESTSGELLEEVPYDLDFDIIKTNSVYQKYEFDNEFSRFLLGYLIINETKERVGIISKNTKLVNNNYIETFTIIRKNGEIFEIYSDYTIEKTN